MSKNQGCVHQDRLSLTCRGEKSSGKSGSVPCTCGVPHFGLLWFFSVLLFRRISKLRSINHPEGFDYNPDSPQLLEAHRTYTWETRCPTTPEVSYSKPHRTGGPWV